MRRSKEEWKALAGTFAPCPRCSEPRRILGITAHLKACNGPQDQRNYGRTIHNACECGRMKLKRAGLCFRCSGGAAEIDELVMKGRKAKDALELRQF